ncbi:MAG: flagellar hook-basal body complex protein [Desulfobacteraceae bacterium]|nr:flagellar hook-basal body complex protein [Desulfobacteraceae bacterium]
MSLSSSLFTGTSGLTNMGNAMQVVGNNIANTNTVGFKKGRSTFADTLSQSVATQAGSAQVGRGMSIGAVDQNFDTGSFESTGNATDLSIGGDGFFVVRQSNSENNFYTRAGNFHFDKSGQLVNPEGYLVQGWELDEETGDDMGSIKDIVLEAFTSPPKKSTKVSMITNLDADAESQAVVLSNRWDSSSKNLMDPTNYEYQSVVKVHDALGSTHDITVYYDKKSGTDWEYVVTCNPSEDNRNLVQGTDSKGLLARGTISFSESSGDILDFSMEEFTGRIGNVQANGVNSEEDIKFHVEDSEKMSLDGYGFDFEFDGSQWAFSATGKPTAYPNAKIVYSDDQTINIVLNPDNNADVDPDLRIKLDQPAVATDSIGFDINDPTGLHVQGIEGTTYFGDTANDNTSLEINAPEVMTHDSDDVGLIWYPAADNGKGRWDWKSDPAAAETAGTLVSNIATIGTVTPTIPPAYTDSSEMTMLSAIAVQYDGADWDWNYPMQDSDIVPGIAPATSLTSWATPHDSPTLTINAAGSGIAKDAAAGQYNLTYTAATTSWTITPPAAAPATVPSATGNEYGVTFELPSGAKATYSFATPLTADGSIDFTLDPSPPVEYPNAEITPGMMNLEIDFDTSAAVPGVDMTITMAGAVADDTVSFDVLPGVPPTEYANATIKGDKDKAVIDLDGSGNDDDKEDIVFTFTESLKSGPTAAPYDHRSEITFDIKGSTAWTEKPVDEIKTTGYYSFNTDFLGGEFGTTETDIQFDIGTKFDGTNFINDSLSTTQYARASTTTFQDADGYSAGDLQGVNVASDGVMTGIYSNGQLIPLFRVGLAKFLNNNGLSSEGGNLFSATRESGNAITNKPGENGLGTIAPNSLEMSNVDISEEFVKMITTQRGFQANSKTITTVDGMMETVIQMKR